jgi:hypothetical protein
MLSIWGEAAVSMTMTTTKVLMAVVVVVVLPIATTNKNPWNPYDPAIS